MDGSWDLTWASLPPEELVPSCRVPHWPEGGRTAAPSPCVPERRESEEEKQGSGEQSGKGRGRGSVEGGGREWGGKGRRWEGEGEGESIWEGGEKR